MKAICAVLLLCASMLVTGCAGDIWMTMYRIKGGYYDRPSTKIPKRSADASIPVSQ